MFSKIVFIYLCFAFVASQDICYNKQGAIGVCKNIAYCQPAIDDLKRKIHPQICGFDGADPIVCCVKDMVLTTSTTIICERETSGFAVAVSMYIKYMKPRRALQCLETDRPKF